MLTRCRRTKSGQDKNRKAQQCTFCTVHLALVMGGNGRTRWRNAGVSKRSPEVPLDQQVTPAGAAALQASTFCMSTSRNSKIPGSVVVGVEALHDIAPALHLSGSGSLAMGHLCGMVELNLSSVCLSVFFLTAATSSSLWMRIRTQSSFATSSWLFSSSSAWRQISRALDQYSSSSGGQIKQKVMASRVKKHTVSKAQQVLLLMSKVVHLDLQRRAWKHSRPERCLAA